jgi:hypothetical protein
MKDGDELSDTFICFLFVNKLAIKEGPLIKNGPINFVHIFFPNSP